MAVGGDRPLPLLVSQIATCKVYPRAGNLGEYDLCGAVFPELRRLLREDARAEKVAPAVGSNGRDTR